jgi:tape measure domain-containing protein
MVVQELIAKLGFDVDEGGLNKADNGLAKMAKTAAMAVAAMYALKQAFNGIVYAVSEAADLESLNAEFEVMLKNADAAKYLVQEIQQFAAETPFETKGLVENVRLIMAFGESAQESLKAVKMLGDVAGSNQEKLGRLSLAYAQVMSAGKLQGQDLLQFVNAGFNPLKELSQMTGKSIADLRKEMEKGLITSDMVKSAFASATGEGGLFYKNMEKQAQTLNGLWSTLKDNFNIMIQGLGTLLIPAIKAVIVAFLPLMDQIAGAFRQLGDFFILLFTGGPSAEDQAAAIAAAFMTIADAVMLVMTTLQGFYVLWQTLVGGMAATIGAFMDMVNLKMKAWAYIGKMAGKLMVGIGNLTGNQALIRNGASLEAYNTEKIGGGFLSNTRAGHDAALEGVIPAMDKYRDLGNMIGGSKDAPAGSKVQMSDSILAALQGRAPVTINNNNQSVNNNVTVNADDTIKTAAESLFGKAFQAQLIQLRAATV